MVALSDLEGESLINAIGDADFDPFGPVIVMTPVAGFPKNALTRTGRGDPILIAARDRLSRFRAVDNDRKLDRIEMTFIDEDGFFAEPSNLAHGSVIDVAYGYKGRLSSERRLIIRKLQLQALRGKASARRRKGFIVNLEGQAPGIVGLLDDGADVELFENTRVSRVVKVLAGRMGYHETGKGISRLTMNIPPDDDVVDPVLTKPAAMKVPQFLKYMADRYGFILCTSKKGMFFGARNFDQNPNRIIDAHNSRLISYQLDGDLKLPIPKGMTASGVQKGSWTQARFKVSADDNQPPTNTDYTADEGEDVATTQPKKTSLVESTPGGGVRPGRDAGELQLATTKPVSVGQSIRKRNTVMRDFRPMVASKADIVRIKKFKQRINKLWKLKIRVVGDPLLVAGNTVKLVNFDTPLLDGVWYITEAVHTFDQNYITELTMRRRRSKVKTQRQSVQTIFRKTPTSKAEEAQVYGTSTGAEPQIRGGLQLLTGSQQKTSHRTENGQFVDVTQERKGCK